MEVDGIKHFGLSWEEEYCRYYDIGIIVYCNVNLRQEEATLINIKWVDESENIFTEDSSNYTTLSRYVNEKILLAVTGEYTYSKYPNYTYYKASAVINIKKEEGKIIIKDIEISTDECVKPDKTMTLHLHGYDIVPNELIKNEEDSSVLTYQFEAPKSVPITEYYYNEESNEFEKFNPATNTKEKTTLMVDLDPLTLELIQNMDPKGRKLLNMRLSNMVSEVIEEVNYLINPDDFEIEEE